MADEEYDGRKPSLDSKGRVRGFRTKPGAPMADTTSNFPMSPNRGTPKTNWDLMFKNSLTGNNPLSQEARALIPPPSTDPYSEIWGSNNDFSAGVGLPPGAPALPPLNILAAGGPTHAQSWGGDSFGSSPASPIMGKSFKNRFGTGSVSFDKRLSGGYGWGSNSRVT
jgi:hypothetical protein